MGKPAKKKNFYNEGKTTLAKANFVEESRK